MTTQIVKHHPLDISPTATMAETPFFQWLRNNHDEGGNFIDNLVAYHGITRDEAVGQFAGSSSYQEDGETVTMDYLDCYRHTHSYFWRLKLKGGAEGKRLTAPTE